MITALAAILLAIESQQPYAWPLDLPQAVTSSFGEYRTARFHAGIDLRTGAIGKPVHAPAGGYVWRVGCSPWGYGKVVYLRLTDGNTIVYGHLNDFMPALREYVRQAQHAQRDYSVDLYPEAGQFKVRRGDVVAFSGQTGIGVPHLHYEIRDEANQPINPRLLNITWPDSTRPVIRKLAVFPDGPDSRVNGDIAPLILDVKRTSDGRYTCAPIHARGRIGFGVDVIDPANNGESKLGIHILRASNGDTELFRVQHDRISYDNRENEVVAYHPYFLNKGRFLLLWRWPGNVCDICNQTPSDGWWTVPAAAAEVRIEAVDFLGNTATLAIPVTLQQESAPKSPAQGGNGRGSAQLECVGAWLMLTATFTAPEPKTPALSITGDTSTEEAAFHRVSDTVFRAGYAPSNDATEVTFRVEHPRMEAFEKKVSVFHRQGERRTASFGGFTLGVEPSSPYGVLYAAEEQPGSLPATPLPMRGPAYSLWPADTPIDTPVELGFPLPPGEQDLKRIGVYRATSWGWACESAKPTGNRLVLSTRKFGTYALLVDNRAPTVSGINVGGKNGITSRRPSIRAHVSDVGSGITDIDVTCDTQWLLMEYDPEQATIVWAQDEDLPTGAHKLTFRLIDRAGNATEETREINVPGKVNVKG